MVMFFLTVMHYPPLYTLFLPEVLNTVTIEEIHCYDDCILLFL